MRPGSSILRTSSVFKLLMAGIFLAKQELAGCSKVVRRGSAQRIGALKKRIRPIRLEWLGRVLLISNHRLPMKKLFSVPNGLVIAMCIPEDHGAASVSSVHGIYNRNPVLFSIQSSSSSRQLSLLETANHTPLQVLSRAFSALGYPIYQPPPILSIDSRKPRSSYAYILLFLFLWRISCVAGTGRSPGVSSDPRRRPASNLAPNTSLLRYSSTQMPPNSNVFWTVDDPNGHFLVAKYQARKLQRKVHAATDLPEPKSLNSEMTDFICYRLPDSCARAAYLRQHVRHILCPELPLLYILPYISHWINRSDFTFIPRHSDCDGGLRNLVYAKADSAFEPWLSPSSTCERSLSELDRLLWERLHVEISNLEGILEHSFCKTVSCTDSNEAGEFCCDKCSSKWLVRVCALACVDNSWRPDVSMDAQHTRVKSDNRFAKALLIRARNVGHVNNIIINNNNATTVTPSDSQGALVFRSNFYRFAAIPRLSSQTAYRNWLCAVEFPLFIPMEGFGSTPTARPLFPPESCQSSLLEQTVSSYDLSPDPSTHSPLVTQSNTSSTVPRFSHTPQTLGSAQSTYRLVVVCAHDYWCTQVETFCPYLNPSNLTSNGGEPGFLCHESHYHHSSLYQHQENNRCPTDCRYNQMDLRELSIPKFNRSASRDASESKPCESLQDRCHFGHRSFQNSDVRDDFTSSESFQSPRSDVPAISNTSVAMSSASSKYHFRMRNSLYCWCLLPVLLCILCPSLPRTQPMIIFLEHCSKPTALSIRTSNVRVPSDYLCQVSHSTRSSSVT
ncbi:hypothetical protein T265_11265 [Opisthorchis viverrini]|uniref:Uncharacterized protein n=1 Tax=Opisthorchis viverrini TaxID=6198 RepID=A0A074YZL5_OPIVI|nr:hypothetical protein T265_11265 [Opisthorchis viverrini]KER20118.1 hypothetical protein T265_11265 [Opisthorchis viverrini]